MVGEASLQFGHRLRRLREAAGLTQEALAERAGLSVKAIAALERGRRQRPYPHTVKALADALGLTEAQRAELTGSLPSRSGTEPATQPARAPLPSSPTPLLGREGDLTSVAGLLVDHGVRLVTLTGPGGVGKTRLALEAASRLRDAFDGRVAFVPLAPLSDAALVLPTIARTIGVTEGGPTSIRETIVAYLGNDAWLLVLDNFEHVLSAAPEVADLLGPCPGLSILVTSRATLKVRAEHELPVRPLTLPDPSRQPNRDDLLQVSSVQLFLERALAAMPSFELTEANCEAVASICRRLDGLPLALELVAARVRLLGPADMLARLDRLLPMLVGGARDLPERQQTMRAAINWSHELLEPPVQALFRQLSTFAGGWTLEAAEAVGATGPVHGDVVDHLGVLVEQSMVFVTHEPAGTRYGMLEPIRQFALEQLEAAGEADDARRRHARYFLAFAERAAAELEGRSGQTHWIERLEREHDNLRAALAWSEGAPDGAELGLRLASALWRFWEMRWFVDEGGRWLDGALAKSEGLSPALRARAFSAAGNLARDRADYDRATALHEQGLDLRRELGDARGIAASLNNLGVIARDLHDPERTLELCQESFLLFRAAGDNHGAAIALISLGMAAGQKEEFDRARGYYQESLDWFRSAGDDWHTAWVLSYLSDLELRRGDPRLARQLADESLALHRIAGDAWGIASALSVLGKVDQAGGDLSAAARSHAEALHQLMSARVERAIPATMDDLAIVLLAIDRPEPAARLAGGSTALRALTRASLTPAEGTSSQTELEWLRDGPHAGAWREARASNRDRILSEAWAIADGLVRGSAGPDADSPGSADT